MTTVYHVPDISCEHCKTAIESAVGEVTGVSSVSVDVDAKNVTVVGGAAEAIVAAIDDAGYAVA